MITLNVNGIDDPLVRDNFRKLEEALREFPVYLANFKFFKLAFTSAVTNLKVPHGLGYVPKDVIQTFLSGSGTVTWNYSSFDRTNLVISTSGPCVVRAFIGTYPS